VSALATIRANVKRLRLEQGLTQQQLSERAGMDYKYFQKIESGRWPGLQVRTVETLAKALRVDVGKLFVGNGK